MAGIPQYWRGLDTKPILYTPEDHVITNKVCSSQARVIIRRRDCNTII